MDAKLNFNFPTGLPTKEFVDRLIEETGPLVEGTIIEYKTMEKAFQVTRQTNNYRFRSCFTAWQKRMRREYNIELGSINNIGYQVLSNGERISKSVSIVNQGTKKYRKAGSLALTTPETNLKIEEAKARDHIIAVAATVAAHISEMTKSYKITLIEMLKKIPAKRLDNKLQEEIK